MLIQAGYRQSQVEQMFGGKTKGQIEIHSDQLVEAFACRKLEA